jgi:hypothetical protein
MQPPPSTVTLTDGIILEEIPNPTDDQEISHLSPKVAHQAESPKTINQYQYSAAVVAATLLLQTCTPLYLV